MRRRLALIATESAVLRRDGLEHACPLLAVGDPGVGRTELAVDPDPDARVGPDVVRPVRVAWTTTVGATDHEVALVPEVREDRCAELTRLGPDGGEQERVASFRTASRN